MQELFSQLGIDWRLLISQAVNFLLLLVILWYVAYKPLIKLLHDRRARIEEGLMKADEAEQRLHDVDEINKGKIKEAENQAMGILKKTETDAKTLEGKLLAAAKLKEEEALKNTEAMLRTREEESRRAAERDAAQLVRQALIKTVELSPKDIDDALIARAIKEAKTGA